MIDWQAEARALVARQDAEIAELRAQFEDSERLLREAVAWMDAISHLIHARPVSAVACARAWREARTRRPQPDGDGAMP